jgi:transposase-like protein
VSASRSPEEIIRLIKLARLPSVRIGELCKAEGISPSTFRRWRQTYAEAARWSADDVWLAAIQLCGQPASLDAIRRTYDYLDHARPREEEARTVLARLEQEGWLRRRGEGWVLAREWP